MIAIVVFLCLKVEWVVPSGQWCYPLPGGAPYLPTLAVCPLICSDPSMAAAIGSHPSGAMGNDRNWMESYRTYGEPFVFDFKKLLKALSAKDTAAQFEVDNFMENCAKRWQTKDGTYRLKRRRLPDVRDSPGYPGADIDMADI